MNHLGDLLIGQTSDSDVINRHICAKKRFGVHCGWKIIKAKALYCKIIIIENVIIRSPASRDGWDHMASIGT